MSPEKWFIFIIQLFIVPGSLLCLLPFVLVETAGWLPCRERASHSALCVCCRKNVFSFPPGVYVGPLNLIAWIPGPGPSISYFQFIIKNRYLSRFMGKPTICIGQNKDADQLRGNREADQRLCFRYSDSTIPLLLKSEISSF